MRAVGLVAGLLTVFIAIPASGQQLSGLIKVAADAPASQAVSPPGTEADLTADLQRVNEQIAEAEKDLTQHEGGLIVAAIKSRIAILEVTQAMLEQRLLAMRTGARFEYRIPASQPDPDQAARILEDLRKAREDLAASERKANGYSGGLIHAMALTTVATQRQTIALLEQAYFMAVYGVFIEIPETAMPTAPSASATQAERQEAGSAASEPQPESENPFLVAAREKGLDVVGTWIINRSKSPVDDAPNYDAIVFEKGGASSNRAKSLRITCFEGETRFLYDPETFLLATDDMVGIIYRIDKETAVQTRWSISINNQVTGLWGARESRGMLRSLLGKKKIFIQATERTGETHRATFNLEGIEVVAAEVAKTCNWKLEPPAASAKGSMDAKSEGIRLQEALKAAGVYGGPITGTIGPMTKAALGRYQAREKLPVTGEFDEATRKALGLLRQSP